MLLNVLETHQCDELVGKDLLRSPRKSYNSAVVKIFKLLSLKTNFVPTKILIPAKLLEHCYQHSASAPFPSIQNLHLQSFCSEKESNGSARADKFEMPTVEKSRGTDSYYYIFFILAFKKKKSHQCSNEL